jgi:hypothetical protein
LTLADKWVNLTATEREIIVQLVNNSDGGLEKEKNTLIKKLAKANKTISVASRKGKGRELQHFACKEISKLIGIPFDNQDDSCEIHSREMGQSGVDVVLRGKAQERFPYSIECKSGESISLRSFVLQAKANKKEGTDWLLLIRTKSIPEDVVVIGWEAFANLFKRRMNDKKNVDEK